MNDRLNWTIKHRALWYAKHISGVEVVAKTESELMSKINEHRINNK